MLPRLRCVARVRPASAWVSSVSARPSTAVINGRAFEQSRCLASNAQRAPRTIRIPPLPLALIGVGFTCLGIGLYEYFTSDIQKYPQPVRQALRKALYYQQNNKDVQLSIQYFKEALEKAIASPELERDGAPLTGIMIQLGTLFESLGRLPEARQTLVLGLRHLVGFENDRTDGPKKPDSAIFDVDLARLPVEVQKKAVGIAQKLGDITAAMRRDDEAERWYTWSVEHLLTVSSKPVSEYGDSPERLFNQEHMPAWLTNTDVGAALEALGGFYAARNKPSYAIHLYLRALTLAGVQTCHATVIMNNLSEAFMESGMPDEAKLWAERGLELAQNPNTGKANKDGRVCDETCGVLLFNMGMILERTNDMKGAKEFYKKAQAHGLDHHLAECVQQAGRALRRLESEKNKHWDDKYDQ